MITFGDPSLPPRFWAKVQIDSAGCWLWTACKVRAGYGHFRYEGKPRSAHRVAYVALVGAIPSDLTLDHLCRVRNCVNPNHLEPVTGAENTRRGNSGKHQASRTHCPRGHEYTPENIYHAKNGTERACRTCSQDRSREYQRHRRARLREQARQA